MATAGFSGTMNQQMEEKFVSLLDWIGSSANATGAFLAEQAPDVIAQYLSWYF